ncbi:MAG: hypothetical protein AB7I18_05140 [Candidatus Berkiella sp.]
MPKGTPFFSALEDPKVQYHSRPQNWISRTFATLYQSVSRNKVISLLGSGILAIGNLYAVTQLPLYASLPLEAGILFVGAHYFAYHLAQRRKVAFLHKTAQDSPPNDMHPMLKERKVATFNHVFSFIKAKGQIWYALRENIKKPPNWQLFYIDNLQMTPRQFANAEMIADGENFMLRVPGRRVDTIYYKKVIEEARVGEHHIISSLCEEPEAIDSWFTLPVLNLLKPSQLGKRLTLAKNAKWAMSNAGEYKHQVIDNRGQQHANLPITTVYEYDQLLMSLHDPFVEKNSTFKVSLPHLFEQANQIEASASILFASSKKRNTIQLCSIYLDYDSEGINPLLSFTFDVNEHNKRLLPINKTQSHRLPIGMGQIMNLTVLQCGHRPHNVEIRLQSKKEPHCFYYKKWDDQEWKLFDMKTGRINHHVKTQQSRAQEKVTRHQTNLPFVFANKSVSKVSLYDFDSNATFCSMVFEIHGKLNHFILRRHKSLVKSFLGYQSESWSLNPDPQHHKTSFLSGSDAISVEVKCLGDDIAIHSQDKRYDFNIHLQKQMKSSPLPLPLEFLRMTRSRTKQTMCDDVHHQQQKIRVSVK